MKTITLKTDDTLFEHITALAKSLDVTKSELIRNSLKVYESYIKREALKKQIQRASYNVRDSNSEIVQDFDSFSHDGLEDA